MDYQSHGKDMRFNTTGIYDREGSLRKGNGVWTDCWLTAYNVGPTVDQRGPASHVSWVS